MDKTCNVCGGGGIYKCPTCLIFYCSAKCCKKHRAENCDLNKEEKQIVQITDPMLKTNSRSPEEVSAERLAALKNSDEVKNLLSNSHLRDLLITIDQAENAEEIMQKAMLEPIFVEFADACIKAVDPQDFAVPGTSKDST